MFQRLFAIKKSGRQVPGEMGTGHVPIHVPTGANVAPSSTGLPLVKPRAVFSAWGYFRFEAWPGVCPRLQPQGRICASCTQGCSARTGAAVAPRPHAMAPSLLRPCSHAGSVMSRAGPCGTSQGVPCPGWRLQTLSLSPLCVVSSLSNLIIQFFGG